MSLRTPNPATAIAIVALTVAIGGTAIAAGTRQGGDKLIKKHSLSGNRLRNHTVTGTQVNVSKLGKVPSAGTADTATKATTAGHATTADTATTANGLPPLTWTPLTLMNGWISAAPHGYRAPAIAVDAQGIVHLEGGIECPATCQPEITLLPRSYLPNAEVRLAADEGNDNTGMVDVFASGQLSVADDPQDPGSSFFTSLEGLTYSLR